MRVRATCEHCGREFLFFQLYNADPSSADRCPHCGRHLGVPNVRPLALRTDRAAAELVRCLDELAAGNPSFRVDPASLLDPIREAVVALAARGGNDEADRDRNDDVRHPRWPWQRHRQAA